VIAKGISAALDALTEEQLTLPLVARCPLVLGQRLVQLGCAANEGAPRGIFALVRRGGGGGGGDYDVT
jgi:hypothetical protein